MIKVKMSVLVFYLHLYLVLLNNCVPATPYYQNEASHCQCCTGPSGIPGVPGKPGIRGLPGVDGFKGEKGEQGNVGLTGITGASGPQGDRGRRGRKGLKGECGPRGLKGSQGSMGLKGQKGQKGGAAKIPSKVAFSASRTSRMGPIYEDTIVTYDNVFINIGESFDLFTSTFICKINGTYLFTAHVLCNLDANAFGWIMVNGNHMLPMHGDNRAGYGSGSNTIILHLNQDDHVWIQLSKNSSLLNDYSTFSGYLIYED